MQPTDFQSHLQTQIFDQWLPRAVDPKGGFHQNYAEDWSELPDSVRSIVYQCRLTWLASMAGQTEIAEHGVKFLMGTMWDAEHGGFYWNVDLAGQPANPEKHSYGQAFAIYALARAGAIEESRMAFQWLLDHAKDDVNGGFFETCSPEGKPLLTGEEKGDAISTPFGLKSMNTNIHILEALVELFEQTKAPDIRAHLVEIYEIVRDRYVTTNGELNYYLTTDWQLASTVDSYGHELETAYLLLEAAEALGMPDDKLTWHIAKKLVDHPIKAAWDSQLFGFFDEGHIGKPPHHRIKGWWTQAEGLNALRVMAEKFGEPYQELFAKQWQFILTYQIDKQYGGWYQTVLEDGTPESTDKSGAWTEGYHQARAIFLATGQKMYHA